MSFLTSLQQLPRSDIAQALVYGFSLSVSPKKQTCGWGDIPNLPWKVGMVAMQALKIFPSYGILIKGVGTLFGGISVVYAYGAAKQDDPNHKNYARVVKTMTVFTSIIDYFLYFFAIFQKRNQTEIVLKIGAAATGLLFKWQFFPIPNALRLISPITNGCARAYLVYNSIFNGPLNQAFQALRDGNYRDCLQVSIINSMYGLYDYVKNKTWNDYLHNFSDGWSSTLSVD